MRKYIALVLALVCVLGLVGCSANTVDKEKPVFEVDREKPIFETENICKITLFAIPYHADGIVVPSEYMDEITVWIGTFTIDKEAGDKLDPGTNTFSFRLEYSDGTIVESGVNTTTIDGITYYMKNERAPECFNALFTLKRESTEPIIFVQDFSYAKDSEVYTEGKPGVKTSGFLNTSEMEINADNVVERAKNECTIHWREVSVRRDTAAGIWLVVFGNHYPGGGQSVYLDDHGKTVLIVYGE